MRKGPEDTTANAPSVHFMWDKPLSQAELDKYPYRRMVHVIPLLFGVMPLSFLSKYGANAVEFFDDDGNSTIQFRLIPEVFRKLFWLLPKRKEPSE